MKKLLLIAFLALPVFSSAQSKVDVYVFTSPSCIHCIKFKQEMLPLLKGQYKDEVNFVEYDTSEEGNNIKLGKLAEEYKADAAVPALIAGDKFIIGYPTRIGTEAVAAIEQAIKDNARPLSPGQVDVKETFQSITFAAIVINGLIDGINPCAFAVIVFFISFLTIYGYNKKEVIYVGSAYCLAVFLTYILLGFGFFKVLYALEGFQALIKVFYILTAAVCFIFFGLSVYDFLVYRKTKDSKTMLLQLPASLKARINKVIGFFLRGKNTDSPLRLIIASFAVGFIVSLVEAVCTGQVYIPTIVLILQDPQFRVRAILYLLLYNVMFILPLLGVFILSAAGCKSEGISNCFKRHLGLTKILLSLVFLVLGIMLISNI